MNKKLGFRGQDSSWMIQNYFWVVFPNSVSVKTEASV